MKTIVQKHEFFILTITGNFVIMKGNKFVSIGGRKTSYTSSIMLARRFKTYDEALRNKCGNERVVKI